METTTEYLAPISILRLFETTKEQRGSFVTQVIERMESGNADPLETHLQIKCMEEVVKQVTGNDVYKGYILEAAQKEGKSFAFHNAKFETKEVGVKYSFDNCGDTQWELLSQQKQSIDAQLKARESFLKTVPLSGLVITDEQTGETAKVYPPSKLSTTSVCVTLK